MLSLGAPDSIDYKFSFPSVFKERVKEHAIPRSRAKRFPAAPGVSARPATLLHALYVLLLA